MALFGIQLVMTLILLSVLNKLSAHYSIGKWLLSHGLIRYLHPSDEHLREIVGLPKNTSKGNRNRREYKEENSNTFNVPRNICLTLEAEQISVIDVIQLPFYAEFQWLLDFGVYALIIYAFTEFYYFLIPNSNEYNLSLVWCSLVVAFSLKILFSITALYFRGGDEAIGERSLCLVSGCLFFLTAMIVLIADENFLEFGLIPAYNSFNESAFQLLEAHGMAENANGPTSLLIVKFCLALWSGLIGAFFIFPGLRFAKMHLDSVNYNEGNHLIIALLNVSFISPLFVILMWIKPIARDYLTNRVWSTRGTIMSSDSFETTRIIVIIVIISLRMCLIRRYLQSYLNIAPQKLTFLKKETGRITNIDLQKLIARVFYYLCVVSLQYITPLFICLFMTLIMKSLGNYSWSSFVWNDLNSIEMTTNFTASKTGAEFTIAMLKRVFNPIVLRGLTGFMVWWLCSVWFTTSTIGFIYHSYFT